jgi:hypothetical protein
MRVAPSVKVRMTVVCHSLAFDEGHRAEIYKSNMRIFIGKLKMGLAYATRRFALRSMTEDRESKIENRESSALSLRDALH